MSQSPTLLRLAPAIRNTLRDLDTGLHVNIQPWTKEMDHPLFAPVPPPPPTPDKKYFGTVTLLTVISDKGYVCSTHVLRGINREINKKTEETARQWRFDPARKGGRTVPVVVSVDVNYWTTSTGEIVSDPPHPPSSVQSEEPTLLCNHVPERAISHIIKGRPFILRRVLGNLKFSKWTVTLFRVLAVILFGWCTEFFSS